MSRIADRGWAFWWRTPLLLRRPPLVALAIAGSGLILAMSGAAAPLFVSSAQNATLAQQFASYCPYTSQDALSIQTRGALAGTVHVYWSPNGSLDQRRLATAPADWVVAEHERMFRAASAQVPHLAPVVHTAFADRVMSIVGPADAQPSSLAFREGALAHVQRLSSVGGPGIWLTDTAARSTHARAGDMITLRGTAGSGRVRVAGIYRDLATTPRTANPFWCTIADSIWTLNIFSNNPQPPLTLVTDPGTLATVSRLLGSPSFDQYYERPFRLPLTVPQTQTVDAALSRVAAQINVRRRSTATPSRCPPPRKPFLRRRTSMPPSWARRSTGRMRPVRP